MFNKIFDLSFPRTAKQAWGFYFGHLIIILVSGLILAALYGIIFSPAGLSDGFNQGVKIGSVIGIIYVAVLTLEVIRAKGLMSHFKYVLLAFCAIILAVIGGGILGLIIPSVLSKKPISPTPVVLP